MKKYSFLFFCLLIILNSCNDSSSVKEKIQNIFKEESSTIEKDSKDSNIRRTSFENGNIKTEITAVNNKKHGLSKKYYSTGELHTIVNYKNGIKDGEAIWYYKDGKPYRVTQYINGKMEGIRKTYYKNGTIQAEVPYKNDVPIDGLKEYNKQGKLITNYPKIVFESRNNISIDNKFILICKMSDKAKNVIFYNEILVDGEKRLIELKTIDGITRKEFHIPASSIINKKVIIHAKIKTPLGNPYETSRTYNLKLDTR